MKTYLERTPREHVVTAFIDLGALAVFFWAIIRLSWFGRFAGWW